MIRKLLTVQILLLAGLSSVFLLPQTPPMKDAALNMELPRVLTLAGWTSEENLVKDGSTEERAILANDTEFAKRTYRREVPASELDLGKLDPRIQWMDELHTGIVLSGKDLSGSIHALERCLSAQGFNIPQSSTIRIPLRSGKSLPVRRLVCEKVFQGKKGEPVTARSIAYYWFVGFDSVTSNHIDRGIKDFKDRIFEGYDQRWGYVTVTAQLDMEGIFETPPPDAKPDATGRINVPLKKGISGKEMARRPLTPAQADHLVEEFISDLGPDILKMDQIKNWPEE